MFLTLRSWTGIAGAARKSCSASLSFVCLRSTRGFCCLSQRPEEGADVLRQQLRLLHRGEVAAARQLGPVLQVVAAFDPLARRHRRLLRQPGHSAGHLNALALPKLERALPPFVV